MKTSTKLVIALFSFFSFTSSVSFAQDIGVNGIVSPTDGSTMVTGTPFNFIVNIKNYGSVTFDTTTSFTFKYQFRTSVATLNNVRLTSPILAGDSLNVGVTTGAFNHSTPAGPGYLICAWTELPGDVDNSNDTSCITITIQTTIDELTAALKDVYYANDNIHIHFDDYSMTNISVELYNITGQVVKSENIKNNELWNVSDIAKGVYVLRLRNGNNEYIGSKKMFIE